MANMYSVAGTFDYTYLCADPQCADVISVPVQPGTGSIARGTVMYRTSSGQYAAAAASDCVDTNQLVVLNETVDISGSVAEDAAAYRAGKMIDGKVVTSDGVAVTDAIKVVLRKQGIVFESAAL